MAKTGENQRTPFLRDRQTMEEARGASEINKRFRNPMTYLEFLPFDSSVVFLLDSTFHIGSHIRFISAR